MLISPLYYGSTDKFGTTILTHLFCPHFGGKSSTEHHSASGFPPRSDEKIYANLRDCFISVSYIIIRMSKRERFMCRPRRPLRRCAAPPPPRRWEALWAANRTSTLSIAAHPVEKDSSIAKIVQIYTIGGLRASKQTLAEQVSKACDSPPTHFCRSSEARFRSVSVFRRTSTRSLAKRGVCAEHAAVTLCAHES